ncbi:serine O-acetyltransferase EpsC [Priestia megaterium]|uniref:serine O-acetyltransferase EpsC n=1 Tax=Priestia megaterium TaxID=1404 RepID=UPI003D049936
MFIKDLERLYGKRPGKLKILKLLVSNTNIQCIALLRLQNCLFNKKVPFIPTLIKNLNLFLTGADIGIGVEIGKGLIIRHSNGIVVGRGAVIGDNCTLLQQVTIGEKYGDGSDPTHRYPSIGNNVTLSAGAKIIGPIILGDNVVVGANAVVIKDVPNNSVAVGIPAVYKEK